MPEVRLTLRAAAADRRNPLPATARRFPPAPLWDGRELVGQFAPARTLRPLARPVPRPAPAVRARPRAQWRRAAIWPSMSWTRGTMRPIAPVTLRLLLLGAGDLGLGKFPAGASHEGGAQQGVHELCHRDTPVTCFMEQGLDHEPVDRGHVVVRVCHVCFGGSGFRSERPREPRKGAARKRPLRGHQGSRGATSYNAESTGLTKPGSSHPLRHPLTFANGFANFAPITRTGANFGGLSRTLPPPRAALITL